MKKIILYLLLMPLFSLAQKEIKIGEAKVFGGQMAELIMLPGTDTVYTISYRDCRFEKQRVMATIQLSPTELSELTSMCMNVFSLSKKEVNYTKNKKMKIGCKMDGWEKNAKVEIINGGFFLLSKKNCERLFSITIS